MPKSRKTLKLTVERVRELLAYDPETGAITWRVDKGRAKAGVRAGKTTTTKYVSIKIDGHSYLGHRLAFLLQTGAWPKSLMDHRNQDGLDNRWSNLREATFRQNNLNRKKFGSQTTLKGATFDRRCNRYYAHGHSNGKPVYLGCFKTEQEAHDAYLEFARKHYGEFVRAA